MFTQKGEPEQPIIIGVESLSFLHCFDPRKTTEEVGNSPGDLGDQGRDTVSLLMLGGAPPCHRTPRYPKTLFDKIRGGMLNGLITFVWADTDEEGYVEYRAYEFLHEYCVHTSTPCLEATEPSSVLMYVDLRRPSEQSSRPPPEEYHWPPRASGAIPSSLQYTPEAVMVSAQVFIVSSPNKARGLEADGKLLFCVFGAGTKVWPDGTAVEPHGDGCGGYIQDLTWLWIGWLQGKNLSELPDY